MSFIFKDYSPQNARVIIDYKAFEPVKFSYPINKSYINAVFTSGLRGIIYSWWGICLRVFFYIFIIDLIITSIFKLDSFVFSINNFLYYLLIILFLPITIFISLAFINKDFFSSFFPKLNATAALLWGRLAVINFKPENVYENKVSIPLFNNVFLEYKAYGDFDRFLEKVEIMEYPFKYKGSSILFPFLITEKINENYFRAIFYFSEKPMEGELNAKFI